MIRPSTLLWASAVVVVGYAMFQVKYEVMHQETQLARLKHETVSDREAVRVLTAEWSFLNQPARLDELSRRYLDLVPIGTKELGSIAAIPLRDATQPQPGAAFKTSDAR
jgi:hypothetical protein